MIFSAKNEDGIPLWKLVMSGEKTVTRRKHPEPVRALRSVQEGRGKKGMGYIYILSCRHEDKAGEKKDIESEAKLEGFREWKTIVNFLVAQYGNDNDVYRLKFVKVDECCGKLMNVRDDGSQWCECGRGCSHD